MALVRIKDDGTEGWQDVWARYHQNRPFPTPANYVRRRVLHAIATYFSPADMPVANSWIADEGFDSPLKLTEDEATEVARQIHAAVEITASQTTRYWEKKLWDEFWRQKSRRSSDSWSEVSEEAWSEDASGL